MAHVTSVFELCLGAIKYYHSNFFHVFENCFGPPHAGELKYEHFPRVAVRLLCATLGPQRIRKLIPSKWLKLIGRSPSGMIVKEWIPLQFANFTTWPQFLPTVQYPPVPEEVPFKTCRITYCGHSSLLIQMDESNIVIDPLFSYRAGSRLLIGQEELWSFGVRRTTPPPFELKDPTMPRIDLILISHTHVDAFDKPAVKSLLHWSGPTLCGGRGMSRQIWKDQGPASYFMDWYETIKYDALKIQFLPAVHSSGRGFPMDRNGILWGSWLVANDNIMIFHAGGTGYSEHFQFIAKNVQNLERQIDLAILPIGHYEVGPIANIYLTPEEAVKAFKDLKAKKALAIHHDTFPVGIEAYGQAKRDLLNALLRENISPKDFFVMDVGQHFYLNGKPLKEDSEIGRVDQFEQWTDIIAWENELNNNNM